jgi:osmotically-inducible protein OsmY
MEKVNAERVAERVYGVKAVANDLSVRLISGYERTDTEIPQATAAALAWNTVPPADRVTATVDNGCVTLNGTRIAPKTPRTAVSERVGREKS